MVHYHQPAENAGILCGHHALEPFYYNPDFVTPSNIVARDSDESVVSEILKHHFSDPKNKLLLVKCLIDETPGDTWGNRWTLKDVEAFHHYYGKRRCQAQIDVQRLN